MSERCVVCGQPLPAGVSEAEMHRRLDKLASAAAEEAAASLRRELERGFRIKLSAHAATIRKRALAEAEASSRRKLAVAERKLEAAKIASQRAVEKAVREANVSSNAQLASLQRKLEAADSAAERAAKKAAKQAAAETAKRSQRELDLVKERGAKERAQHAADTARLKTKVDELSLKLERQTSEQMGDMTEADALAALKRAFPHDDIQRIGRGVRGADILQKVIVDGGEVGRIVYECKNTSSWQNEWLTKARGYRTEYQTQWVVIASRCFPRREKWFVVERGVPVIELRLIVRLAEVIRSAVIEIGSLRLTTVGRQAKAQQMFEYVLSDNFASSIKSIAEAITALRAQQSRERQWHTETWAKNLRLYDEVDGGQREIAAQVRAISEAPARGGLRAIAGLR
ncbi:MAG TPA: DUF2130 domain-containing protein [Gemmatimonadaceae bacterium]|nr:DUF2130 domain-containing protein [Gemmatimonadaceae bacterium]